MLYLFVRTLKKSDEKGKFGLILVRKTVNLQNEDSFDVVLIVAVVLVLVVLSVVVVVSALCHVVVPRK